MSFIEDLVGYKNIIGPDGRQMPRRYAVSFEGNQVAVKDDPARELTIVSLGGTIEGELAQVEYELVKDNDLVFPDGIGPADIVRLSTPTDLWAIAGISVAGLTKRRKILINTTGMLIKLGGVTTGLDPEQILHVPFLGMTLPYQAAIEVVWVPASGDGTLPGWRLI